jgi:hypothetical protein
MRAYMPIVLKLFCLTPLVVLLLMVVIPSRGQFMSDGERLLLLSAGLPGLAVLTGLVWQRTVSSNLHSVILLFSAVIASIAFFFVGLMCYFIGGIYGNLLP